MLYDSSADVIRKALRGLNLAPSQAAELAGLGEKDVLSASRTPAGKELLEKLAPALGLNGRALAGLDHYEPQVPLPSWLERLELPHEDETVNAWLIRTEDLCLLIDTGTEPRDAVKELEKRGIQKVHVLLTHGHGDHIGGLPGLRSRCISIRGQVELGEEPAMPGDVLPYGELKIQVIPLPGHYPGAIGFRFEIAGVPLCAVGDALFAGSMGGCAAGLPYQTALDHVRAEVMSLSPETLLLTGHGPASTVALELKANPFFAIQA
jgi:hydroxyacylglutathione hydrolase